MALEIRTYVIQDADGSVVAVKLNRTSAMACKSLLPGGTITPKLADKRMPDKRNDTDD